MSVSILLSLATMILRVDANSAMPQVKRNTCPVTCPRMVAELVVATTEREFVLTWLRLWSGHTRQSLWVAFVRTLASSAPSCPDRAHEWCRVLGTEETHGPSPTVSLERKRERAPRQDMSQQLKDQKRVGKGTHESADFSDEREIAKYRSLHRHGSRCMIKRLCKYCSEDLDVRRT